MSCVDQKSNPKWKAYYTPEKSYIQIKCRNEHICILSPLHAGTFALVQSVPTDAVNSLIVTVIQSLMQRFLRLPCSCCNAPLSHQSSHSTSYCQDTHTIHGEQTVDILFFCCSGAPKHPHRCIELLIISFYAFWPVL